MREARRQADIILSQINAIKPDKGYYIEHAYGRPKVYDREGNEISPRLPMTELVTWLYAFHRGMVTGRPSTVWVAYHAPTEGKDVFGEPTFIGAFSEKGDAATAATDSIYKFMGTQGINSDEDYSLTVEESEDGRITLLVHDDGIEVLEAVHYIEPMGITYR